MWDLFDSPLRVANELPSVIQVPQMIEICEKYGIMMKEHNTDYLLTESLEWHPRLGIHAANVAPEFGVAETRAFVKVLEENSLNQLAEQFLQISYESGKWKKWMLKDTKASDRDRSLIAGHYVFSTGSFRELKQIAQDKLAHINLDHYLKSAVKQSILRYMKAFHLLRAS